MGISLREETVISFHIRNNEQLGFWTDQNTNPSFQIFSLSIVLGAINIFVSQGGGGGGEGGGVRGLAKFEQEWM